MERLKLQRLRLVCWRPCVIQQWGGPWPPHFHILLPAVTSYIIMEFSPQFKFFPPKHCLLVLLPSTCNLYLTRILPICILLRVLCSVQKYFACLCKWESGNWRLHLCWYPSAVLRQLEFNLAKKKKIWQIALHDADDTWKHKMNSREKREVLSSQPVSHIIIRRKFMGLKTFHTYSLDHRVYLN